MRSGLSMRRGAEAGAKILRRILHIFSKRFAAPNEYGGPVGAAVSRMLSSAVSAGGLTWAMAASIEAEAASAVICLPAHLGRRDGKSKSPCRDLADGVGLLAICSVAMASRWAIEALRSALACLAAAGAVER